MAVIKISFGATALRIMDLLLQRICYRLNVYIKKRRLQEIDTDKTKSFRTTNLENVFANSKDIRHVSYLILSKSYTWKYLKFPDVCSLVYL